MKGRCYPAVKGKKMSSLWPRPQWKARGRERRRIKDPTEPTKGYVPTMDGWNGWMDMGDLHVC